MDSHPDYSALRCINRLADGKDDKRSEAYEKVFLKLYKKQLKMAYVKKEKLRKHQSWNGKLFSDHIVHIKELAKNSGESEAFYVRRALDMAYGLPKETEVK